MNSRDADRLRRTAKINRDADGDPVGIALFVTADELFEIGVNPMTADYVGLYIDDDGNVDFRGHR